MTDSVAIHPSESLGWSWWRFLWYSALIGIVYAATQIFAVVFISVAKTLTVRGFDADSWTRRAGSDGFVLSVAICAALATFLPLVRFLAGRREKRPWDFLGFRHCPAGCVLRSILAMFAFIGAADLVTMALGRIHAPTLKGLSTVPSPKLKFVLSIPAR